LSSWGGGSKQRKVGTPNKCRGAEQRWSFQVFMRGKASVRPGSRGGEWGQHYQACTSNDVTGQKRRQSRVINRTKPSAVLWDEERALKSGKGK